MKLKITNRKTLLCAAFLAPFLSLSPISAGEIVAPIVVPQEKRVSSFIDPALLGFGNAGFTLAVTASGGMDYDEPDGEDGSLDYFDGRARVPLIGRELVAGTYVGANLNYRFASFDASQVGLRTQSLHSADLSLVAASFPTGREGWMGIVLLNPGIASDLRGVSGDDFTLSAIGVFGYQFSSRLTVAVSGVYSRAIGESTAIPGVGIIWKPTDTLTLQLLPPIVAIGWTPLPAWTFSLNAYPGGGAWDVDEQGRDERVEAVNLEVWRAGVGVEHRMGGNWRVTAVAGANLGGSLELRDSDQRVLLDRDLKTSAFGLLGVAFDF